MESHHNLSGFSGLNIVVETHLLLLAILNDSLIVPRLGHMYMDYMVMFCYEYQFQETSRMWTSSKAGVNDIVITRRSFLKL